MRFSANISRKLFGVLATPVKELEVDYKSTDFK
jgi:hypothetical protein